MKSTSIQTLESNIVIVYKCCSKIGTHLLNFFVKFFNFSIEKWLIISMMDWIAMIVSGVLLAISSMISLMFVTVSMFGFSKSFVPQCMTICLGLFAMTGFM